MFEGTGARQGQTGMWPGATHGTQSPLPHALLFAAGPSARRAPGNSKALHAGVGQARCSCFRSWQRGRLPGGSTPSTPTRLATAPSCRSSCSFRSRTSRPRLQAG